MTESKRELREDLRDKIRDWRVDIGRFLQGRREDMEYSLEEIAALTGMQVHDVKAVESGQSDVLNHFLILVGVLGGEITVDWLHDWKLSLKK